MSLFDELWSIKCQGSKWWDHEIYGILKKDVMVPSSEESEARTITKGTRVRVWMVSRFGDVGITDNLTNPIGYDVRVGSTILGSPVNGGPLEDYLGDVTIIPRGKDG